MVIHHISYSRISLQGLVVLADQTLTAINQNHPDEPFLSKSKSSLKEARDLATNALESVDREKPAMGITEADFERDNSYDSLRNHIKSGLMRHNEEYRNACARLYAIFIKNNTTLASLPYEEETAALKSLISDLRTESAAADLEKIHATEWLAELIADQSAFQAITTERNLEQVIGEPSESETMKTLSTVLKRVFNVIEVAGENGFVEDVQKTIALINSSVSEIETSHTS